MRNVLIEIGINSDSISFTTFIENTDQFLGYKWRHVQYSSLIQDHARRHRYATKLRALSKKYISVDARTAAMRAFSEEFRWLDQISTFFKRLQGSARNLSEDASTTISSDSLAEKLLKHEKRS